LSVLTYTYLYSINIPQPSNLSSSPILFQHPFQYSLLLFPSSSLNHPNIHSILVGTYIYLFIFHSISSRTIWPRTFYRSGWLRCDGVISWESCLSMCLAFELVLRVVFGLLYYYILLLLYIYYYIIHILLLYIILFFPIPFPFLHSSSTFPILFLFSHLLSSSLPSNHSLPLQILPNISSILFLFFSSTIFILYLSVLTYTYLYSLTQE
jgi:hypothetical protein